MVGKALIESVSIGQVYFGLSHQDIAALRAPKNKGREQSRGKAPQVAYEQLGQAAAAQMFKAAQAQQNAPDD